MLALAIRVGKSSFLFFNNELNSNYIHLGLAACLVIGPATLFFVNSQLKKSQTFKLQFLLHLLPSMILIGYGTFVNPYQTDRDLWYRIVDLIFVQWGIYLFLSGYFLWNEYKKKKNIYQRRLTLTVFLGSFFVWISYVTVDFTSYISGAITFSFVMYMLLWVLLEDFGKSRRNKKKNISSNSEEGQKILIEAKKILQKEKLYKDPNLTMPVLAKKLMISSHRLSEIINNETGANFSHFLNSFRINAAKEALINQPHLKIKSIAYDCGFNSTSSFYNAFKNETGVSPGKYKNH